MDPIKAVYRHIMFPLLDLRRGTNALQYFQYLKKTQWLKPVELQELQNKKLKALVKHACQTIPYYHRVFKERGLRPDDIKNVADLAKLPILTKKIIRSNSSDLVAKDHKKWKRTPTATSGSTGEPLKYFLDKRSFAMALATMWRGWGWAGYEIGDKRATLAGGALLPTTTTRFRGWLQTRFIERNLVLPAFNMNKEIMMEYAERLRRSKPKFIRGYPSSLYMFAKYLISEGVSDIKPHAVMTTAEMLFNYQRKKIEEAFSCEVFDGYGTNDGGASANECENHSGYHISMERSVMEFVKDSEQVSAGESGKIILTDLCNYAMPFIRYDVGDIGILGDERCPCGRGLPLMESIEGRSTDVLVFVNGAILSGPALTLVFKDLNIEEYQLVQESIDKLLIKVVKGPGYTQKDTDFFMNAINSRVGADIEIIVDFVAKIPTTKAGKRRFIISKIHK